MNGNCTDGSLRLVGGANDTLGLVEVCINNGWGGVCVDHFGTNDAEVICKQLGYSPDGIKYCLCFLRILYHNCLYRIFHCYIL